MKHPCAMTQDNAQHRLAFVYTGMGPQWPGMGQELYDDNLVFRAALHRCDLVFKTIAGWSIVEEMCKPATVSRMAETRIAQPANVVLQIALTEVWRSWGIVPAAMVGHSIGEIAAAYCSGVLSIEDAMQVCYHSSRLHQTLAGQGGMLAVGVSEAEAAALAAAHTHVDVAAVNSPSVTTLAGETQVLSTMQQTLKQRGIFTCFLRVDVAYHSYQIDAIETALRAALVDLSPRPAETMLYSTVTASRTAGDDWHSTYWWRNARQPVQFAATLDAMFADGYVHMLEIGPHPVLASAIRRCRAQHGGLTLHSLQRKLREYDTMRKAYTTLQAHGFRQNLPGENDHTPGLAAAAVCHSAG